MLPAEDGVPGEPAGVHGEAAGVHVHGEPPAGVHSELPADGHVHSEWSWDAPGGSMERTCARAVETGLDSVAFTEHAEFTPWTIPAGELPPGLRARITPEGVIVLPVLDVGGYLECLQRCRDLFPALRIRSGVELSEPHWHGRRTAELLDLGGFDRILASVHCLPAGDGYLELSAAFRERPAAEVVRAYLAEAALMITASDDFAVLAHIDYAVRYWPGNAGTYDPAAFEEEYRMVLRALASTSRALEVNTRIPLDPRIVSWWHEAGGDAVAFGSDAHHPAALARGFSSAAAMVRAHGFRPGRDPQDLWMRA